MVKLTYRPPAYLAIVFDTKKSAQYTEAHYRHIAWIAWI